jgi:hypothetical protein
MAMSSIEPLPSTPSDFTDWTVKIPSLILANLN